MSKLGASMTLQYLIVGNRHSFLAQLETHGEKATEIIYTHRYSNLLLLVVTNLTSTEPDGQGIIVVTGPHGTANTHSHLRLYMLGFLNRYR